MKQYKPVPKLISEKILFQTARTLLQKLTSRKDIHHAILGMETGDGTIRQTLAIGESLSESASISEAYFIASVTKLFIATTVLKLSEEKLIDLDIPIVEYFPSGYLQGLHVLKGNEYTAQLTSKHLLSHSSGLPDWLEDRPRGGKSFLETLLEEADRYFSFDDLLNHVRERLVPLFPPQPLEKGQVRIRYSDTNYQLLIALIERIQKRSIDTVFEEKIFRPVGLKNTFFPRVTKEAEEVRNDAIRTTVLWAGNEPFLKKNVLAATRDLYSTPLDQVTFMKALVKGAIFHCPDTFYRMTEHWNRFSFPTRAADLRLPGYPIQYGWGIMRFELPRWLTPFGKIPPVIGHTGSTGSWLFYCPVYDLYLAGTVDQINGGPVPYKFMPNLLHALHQG